VPSIAGFSERELDVLGVLWDAGPATAAEVRDALASRGLELAYNTVLTVLRILEDKGHVGHTPAGRAHRYHALVARAEAGQSALGRLVRVLFQSSPELLLTHLVRDRSVTPDTVRRLRAVLDAELGEEPGEDAGSGRDAQPGDGRTRDGREGA
jgi:predicted transcriptional regulator